MNNFQIGDEVRMSSNGRVRYKDCPTNPHGSIGRLVSVGAGEFFSLLVDWDNGEQNSYCIGELELIDLIVENE